MTTAIINRIASYEGQKIFLRGWVTHVRHSGKLVFFELRDGSGEIQCVVFSGDIDLSRFETAKNLKIETSCIVEGVVRRESRAKIGYELSVSDILVIQQPDEEFPITPKEHGTAFLFDNRHLWLRSKMQTAILKIRATVINSARQYLDSQDFIVFDAPVLTPVACECTTNLFETKYFDQSAFLTQSGQLYDEAGAFALGKVYSFGPTFRAEKSKTRRHLTEFWMIEPEAAFYELDDMMQLAEQFVTYIIGQVVLKNTSELNILGRDIEFLKQINAPFPRLSYSESIDILKQNNESIEWGDDFGAEHETILSSDFTKPVIVHRYPIECKAFYMKGDNTDSKLSLSFDMLAPEGYGEIIGGGQREDDYETLKNKIISHGLDVKHFSWYLDLRKYGSVPHSGFGMGLERFVTWICGIHHVRETIPFPRMLDKIWP